MAAQQTHRQVRGDLIVTLFQAAMSRPVAEREPYLAEACAGDAALLEEVRRRVKWEARLGGFLLTPVVPRERIDRPFAPGDTVMRGRFRILRLTGEGGMGVVYEAFDAKLGRRIALKCPRFEFRKRLSPEAVKGLQVTHPNVCRVFEIHTEDTPTGEVDFLTMEFLEGETLAARMERGVPARWLETAAGMEIARQVCVGLAAVHAQGIVHRDLKTANVMLSHDAAGQPRAVIMDFGIAQGADLFSSATRGTPDYLAPELWRGQAATVQSDVYALGVLLFEMACGGRKPFAETASWKDRLQSKPSAAELRGPGRSAVLRCLEPDPARRFRSARELETALFQRRWFLRAALGAAASLAAGTFVKRRYWPSSAVRMAVLPPVLRGTTAPEVSALMGGFVHDLSYRLKTLRGVRRPLSVFSPTPDDARTIPAGTHVISSELAGVDGGWIFSAELLDAASGVALRKWTRRPASGGGGTLAAQLFTLQSAIVQETIAELSLRAEPRRHTLTRASYPDYLQGLHYARVDYENAVKAIPYFERVVAAEPDSALGYAGLAEALLNAQHMLTRDKTLQGRALTALAAAEQREPDLAQVHMLAGRLNSEGGWNERALADYRRATEIDPTDPEAFLELGRVLGELDRPDEAQSAFQAAFAAQPGYYKPYLVAGMHFYRMRNFAEAERHWLESVRYGPGQTRARLNLASLYITTGRLAEAQRQAEESIAIKKTRSALETLGALHVRARRYGDAVAAYEEAIKVGPRYYKTWEALAGAYRRAGREADAQRTLRTAIEDTEWGLPANPRDAERVAWCAYYHGALGEVAQARARASQALALANPPSNEVRERLVLAFDQIHDSAAALRLMEGAPSDFLKGLSGSDELSESLRRSPVFIRLMR